MPIRVTAPSSVRACSASRTRRRSPRGVRPARLISVAHKETIAKSVAAGATEGNASDLPPAPVYTDEWNIGTPDAVLSMTEDYPIPATGEINYQYLVVPANFAEDRYITDWEIRPGDRRAVHHLLLYLLAPKEVVEAQMKRRSEERRVGQECRAWS